MDGHGNDADKNNGNSVASGAQGIYSSPELTIDANKISQGSSDNNRSRVASVFANTDAGQRSQKLNDAMGVSSQPVTEDIVINNGPRKRSKAPLIAVLVLLILAGVGVGVYFLVNNMPSGGQVAQTPQEAFHEYRNLLNNGPTNIDDTPDENGELQTEKPKWSIFTIENSVSQSQDQKRYFDELEAKYTTFLETIKNTGTTPIREAADDYGRLLDLVINYNSLNLIQDTVLDKYISDGSETSYQYIETITSTAFNNYILNQIKTLMHDYLDDEYKLIQFYERENCISGNDIDYVCAVNLEETNQAYLELLTHQNNARNLLSAYRSALETDFNDETNKLRMQVGD